MRALEALTKVNETGSKDSGTVRRLATLRARLLTIVESAQVEHAMLLKAHAKRDTNGAMIPDGDGVAVENTTVYQLEVNGLTEALAFIDNNLLLTDSDLARLVEFPDANTLSVLLPLLAP